MHKILSLMLLLSISMLNGMERACQDTPSSMIPGEKNEYIILQSNGREFLFHRLLINLRISSLLPVLENSLFTESQTNVIDVSNMIDENTLQVAHAIIGCIQNKKYHQDKDFPSSVIQSLPFLRTLAPESTVNLVKAAHFFEDPKFLSISARLLAKKVIHKECVAESLKTILPLEAWQEVNRQHFFLFKSFPDSNNNQEAFPFTFKELELYAHEHSKANAQTRRLEFMFPENLRNRIKIIINVGH